MKTTFAAPLAALLLGVAGAIGAYFYGLDQGRALERGAQAEKTVQGVSQALERLQGMTADANAASQALRKSMAERARIDQQTTREFKNVLARSAADRAGCVFPDDVMRQLGAARDRAVQAGTGGDAATVPRSGASASWTGGR